MGDANLQGEEHEAVLVSLTELQARLRGDPATYRRPVVGREIFTVTYDTSAAEEERVPGTPDLRELTERLRRLERELSDVLDATGARADREAGQRGNVVSLQRAIEARLSTR
jgi:hypothetical protein